MDILQRLLGKIIYNRLPNNNIQEACNATDRFINTWIAETRMLRN